MLQNADNRNLAQTTRTGLPSYEQSVSPHTEIPPPYEEAIKAKSSDQESSPLSSSPIPIHSISLSVDRAANVSSTPKMKRHVNSSPDQPQLLWLRHFFAGVCAGGVGRTCTAPIDRLRTFFQVYGLDSHGRMTIKDTFTLMIREGGVRSLWRGNLMNVIKVSPETGLRLMSYETFKRLLGQTTTHEIDVFQKFLCGSAAGFTASALIYPMKTIKTRLTIRKTNEYRSIVDCILKIYRGEGLRAFYKGLLPSALAILPASGIDLALYETLKRRLEAYHEHPTNPIEKLVIGNVSNGISQFFIYPLLNVRTRLQSNVDRSDTMTQILKRLWTHHGIRGLYNGFSLHMLRLAPSSGISFLTFEYVSKLLGAKAL
ncbi:unnamed protein product [Adineta ricciae]|uniref:Uncharacterized protein n=1 Tax=Adineta ricciae TaxID=249248 RepID=A0A814W660_ADIRI|nr:unnamed protein product [Adineta ricciae]